MEAYDVHGINKQIANLESIIVTISSKIEKFNQSVENLDESNRIREDVLISINFAMDLLEETRNNIKDELLVKWQPGILNECSHKIFVDELLDSDIYKYYNNWQCEENSNAQQPITDLLDLVQDLFEKLGDTLKKTIGFMDEIYTIDTANNISKSKETEILDEKIKSELQSLFELSFVLVEMQRNVIRTDTK